MVHLRDGEQLSFRLEAALVRGYFQYPQAGRERTLLLPLPEGKYTHQTLKGQVQMHYREIMTLPPDYEQRIRFTSLLINVRALARSLQKRPPNRYTQHQVEVLREDLALLC